MSTLAQVRRRAAVLGAIVCDDKCGATHECTVEAPAGHRWADGLHMFVDSAFTPWRPDYADMLDRMSMGVVPCTDTDCEWCRPEETDK